MRQVLYLIQKEFRQIRRDRLMMAVMFVAPLIQITILGSAITTNVRHVRTAVRDDDRTPFSREFIRQFTRSEYFTLVAVDEGTGRPAELLDRGAASVVIVIPQHFQRDALRGRQPALQVMVDGIDGNSAGVALGYLADVAQRYQAGVLATEPGLAARQAGAGTRLVEAETRFWYNPDLDSAVYIVPGIVALILLIITVFLTSMAIVREKEIGTLEQLMVTPIRAWQLVLGKIIPFSVLGFIEIIIAIGFVYLVFGIGVAGSVPLLFGEAALFILTTLGLGILVSTISETQQQALFVAWFIMIFAILLSGFFLPIANMPPAVQVITYINPLRYFLVILREIYLKGTGLRELLPETLALALFGVTVFTAAVLRFRTKLG